MADRFSLAIITTLFVAAFAYPALLSGSSPNMISESGGITSSLAYVAMLAIFPAFLGLRGYPVDRKSMGWASPGMKDGLIVVLLTAATIGLGMVFPAGDAAKSLEGAANATLVLLAAVAVVSAAAEEIVFRSWLLRALPLLGVDRRISFVISVSAFALIHAGHGWSSVAFAGIAGTLYAAVFLIRRNLWTVIAAHILHNALAFAVHAVR